MERIECELGATLHLDFALTDMERFAVQYPYTLDLCVLAEQVGLGIDKVMQYRKITEPALIEKFKQAVTFYAKDREEFPALVMCLASSAHCLKDSFPNEELYLINFSADRYGAEISFSNTRKGETRGPGIPCPEWLEGDLKGLWEETSPNMIGVKFHVRDRSFSIAMQGYPFYLRDYSAKQQAGAAEKMVLNIHRPVISGLTKRKISDILKQIGRKFKTTVVWLSISYFG